MAMRFEHEFTVPVPVERAWPVLLDVERVAPCLPGATLQSVEGDTFTGGMRVKVGPITVIYQGHASFEDVDEKACTLTLKASGKEARGSGTAGATVHARLIPEGDHTRVRVETSFHVTGRPAQFGRGVMAEVGSKLIDRFAGNLAALLEEGAERREPEKAVGPEEARLEEITAPLQPVPPAPPAQPAVPAQAAQPAGPTPHRHLTAVPSPPEPVAERRPERGSKASRTADEEALDLLRIAGVPVLKRLAPLLGALAGIAVVVYLIRRRLSR
ncbi:SRPBCC family protein [Microtetraspora sp. NBRC 16547]|uniref:SRPBCC family protein n=1 Tax=Microtetraspora sp. NBRC 16547 TaxID=3030993 RepID=UPI0024A0D30A|nr:SRPBCC family protein [Microtetraspora sp. NBRC 16547]GLW96232.1 carbon monoxide dehydrogenase subunit G [Microtetraspora sp. NBRC 16547]